MLKTLSKLTALFEYMSELGKHLAPRSNASQTVCSAKNPNAADLQSILEQLSRPATDLDEKTQHIELCHQALAQIRRQENRTLWARLHRRLADSEAMNIQGSPAGNIEQAIFHFNQALEELTQEADPEDWAAVQSDLANIYRKRYRGDPAANVDQAIICYKRALEVFTRDADPKRWAAIQFDLGNTYRERLCGDIADNLELALAHHRHALQVYTQEAHPQKWASLNQTLGTSYLFRTRGQRADNLEQAIEYYLHALKVRTRDTDPANWAHTQTTLALAFKNRINGNKADNLERAIAHANQALEIRTQQAYPTDWATTNDILGCIYSDRIYGSRAENLEKALIHHEKALEALAPDTHTWAGVHCNLAVAYTYRIRGERSDNLEQALTHAHQALEIFTQDANPREWALAYANLGEIYRNRLCGDLTENLEQALVHHQQVLEVYTLDSDPQSWANTHYNLAVVYSARLHGDRSDNLEQALRHARQALIVYTRETNPNRWGEVLIAIASAYARRLCEERADNLALAIAHYTQALEVYTRGANPEYWARIQYNLATAYYESYTNGQGDNCDLAINHYKQALEVRTLRDYPKDFQQTFINLGDLYFFQKDWSSAYAAYAEAIRAEHVLLTDSYTETGQHTEVARTADLYPRAAYALLKLGRADEALLQLDQGKTRLLSRALALNEVDLKVLPTEHQDNLRIIRQKIRLLESQRREAANSNPRQDERAIADALKQARAQLNETLAIVRSSNRDFMPQGLGLDQLLSLIATDAVLVAPLVTPHGGAVFILPGGTPSVSLEHVVWLPQLNTERFQALLKGTRNEELGGWLGAFFNMGTDVKSWHDNIESAGETLWQYLMGTLDAHLSTLSVKHVLIMPQSGLGLLPVHAACHYVDGTRRYFLDDYIVSYVPSAYALRVSQDRLRNEHRHGSTLLAVTNPTHDLPFTPVEGEQVARLFNEGCSTILLGNNATADAVKHGTASYVHFACHGFYAWLDPMQSGLILAKGETLNLAQIIGNLNLESTRLITLSACETGITDIRQSPDEYLGLPAGFLQAGAPAVISTLWPVNDRSTMLLMERFYQFHLNDGMEIPTALRQAQIWLRDVTVGELEQRFADEEDDAFRGVHMRMPIETASDYFTYFASLANAQGKHYQPYAHPYYWAAFTFSGA